MGNQGAGSAVCLLLIAAFSLCASGAAQERYCDPELVKFVATSQLQASPNRYAERSGRCEGLYGGRGVSGTNVLLLVSFTKSFDSFDAARANSLSLVWPQASSPVHIRAYSTRPRLYYRMDSRRPPKPASWEWPSNMLTNLGLNRNELGLVAWTTRMVGTTEQPVFMPLRVRAGSAAASSDERLRVVLLPGADLNEVYVTVGLVNEKGLVNKFMIRDEPHKRPPYPADRPITVFVPTLQAAGTYFTKIGADLANGGSTSLTFLFDAF